MDLIALVTAIAAMGTAAGSLVAALRSRPVKLQRSNADLRNRVASMEGELEEQRAVMTRWRLDMDGVLDSVKDTLDAARKQRAKARAAQQRAEAGGQEQEPEGSDIDSLRRMARERGLLM